MDKSELCQLILIELHKVHQVSLAATQSAIESATNEETIPDNKYDTLALEAAYLAHGQAQRVQECEENIRQYRELVLREFTIDTPITVSALVEVVDEHDKLSWFFVGPCGGGLSVCVSSKQASVAVVTPQAPLGKALVGKFLHDEVDVKIGDKTHCYEITQVL
ncbi:transcription elongation factor [Vibrio tapetis]|uniref:Putative Transcription elongation factor,GreA/GreB n=1 Tax=Vibrio tapetis subsp. tapetis TaxID=1671868 RepID=A0A2N8ZC15_9VIBR|nr:transcription elongation factor [Vibrio tapetis]SON49455.1 putative Transcription elongation factor,GreA/GreB [Vibrio tapetis subsp. tapetis]